MKTIADIVAFAKAGGGKRLALAAAQERAALEAALDARAEGIVEPILIGDPAAISELAAEIGVEISGIRVIAAKDYAAAAAAAVALVRDGEAQVLMKGILDSSVLLKAALAKESGIGSGRLASHVAVIESPRYPKPFIVTDAALNIAPDLREKVDIIANAVAVSKALGVDKPKVAMLAAVEKVNPEKMPCTVDAAILSQMQRRGQIKGCVIDGPLALDNAISAESAAIKGIVSEVAGDADILVAPDIEAGNILYKSLVDLGGAKAAAIIAGAGAPIVLTSRSDSRETKLASIALAVAVGTSR